MKNDHAQILALAAAGGALFLMYRKAHAAQAPGSIAAPGAPPIPFAPGSSAPASMPAPMPAATGPLPNTPSVVTTRSTLLKRGMSGRHVATAQRQLVALGLLPADGVDGQFGPATEKAVRAFQKQAGLEVDGIIGPNTARELSAF